MIYVKPLHPRAPAPPERMSEHASGLDIRALQDELIFPGEVKIVRTGYAFELPKGHYGQLRERSSLAKQGLIATAGVIDSDYRGEVMVALANLSDNPKVIKGGERFAQMIVLPINSMNVEVATMLTDTDRGQGGFGSTGAS
jgi:dUTP pyrophosphatase